MTYYIIGPSIPIHKIIWSYIINPLITISSSPQVEGSCDAMRVSTCHGKTQIDKRKDLLIMMLTSCLIEINTFEDPYE